MTEEQLSLDPSDIASYETSEVQGSTTSTQQQIQAMSWVVNGIIIVLFSSLIACIVAFIIAYFSILLPIVQDYTNQVQQYHDNRITELQNKNSNLENRLKKLETNTKKTTKTSKK